MALPDAAPYVYLAHSKDGTDFAAYLYDRLANEGFRVWEFTREKQQDRGWRENSSRVIQEETFALIVVITQRSAESANVMFEWQSALAAQIPVVPLIIQRTEIPQQLGVMQVFNFVPNDPTSKSAPSSEPWAELIAYLRSLLDNYQRAPDIQYISQVGANSDRVAREDQLEFKHYVNAFVQLIRSPHTQPPLTIGIYGSWGMGKSFLLENIVEKLREKPRVEDTLRPPWQRPLVKLGRKLAGSVTGLFRFLLSPLAAIVRRLRRAWRAIQANWFDATPAPESPAPPQNPDVHIVQFNAWEYSATEVIWPGLVRKIMDALERETRWTFPSLFLSKVWRNLKSQAREARGTYLIIAALIIILVTSVAWANQMGITLIDGRILQGTAFLIVSGGLAGILKIVYDAIAPMGVWVTRLVGEKDYAKQVGYMEETRLDLEFLERRLRRNNGRMVIIIDDLDRCEPDKAVEMLQAIKLLLNFDSFIVIMGIDSRIITGAVEKHYQGLLGPAGASGYEYLDKIVQIPFRIPEPTPTEIKTFLQKQMGFDTDGAQVDEEMPLPARAPVVDPEATIPGVAGGLSSPAPLNVLNDQPLKVELVDFRDDERAALEDLAQFLRPNPRHIKRIMNVYRLVRSLASSREFATGTPSHLLQDREATIRWLVICGQWPYTTYMMLVQFERLLKANGTAEALMKKVVPDQADPLTHLHGLALSDPSSTFDPEQQRMLDYDPAVLADLLAYLTGGATERHHNGWMDWEELYEMRRYTINFNPAIESELPAKPPEKTGK